MPDNVYITINNKKIKNFISYKIESDIFMAGDAFELELPSPEIAVGVGSTIKLFINEQLELNGVIERKKRTYNKKSNKKSFTMSGRDLMGIVVGTSVETFETIKDEKLEDLANRLLVDSPFVKIKNVKFGTGDKNRLKELTGTGKNTIFDDSDYDFMQTEPGDTVFTVLNKYASARGLLFFSMPDGTFIFGRPLTSGKAKFFLRNTKDNPEKNNIINGDNIEDISNGHSSVTAMGQQQGTNTIFGASVNGSETVTNDDFPFVKPLVVTADSDIKDIKNFARLVLEKEKFDSFSLEYKTPDHNQGGQNFQVNSICHVEDDDDINNKIRKDFLIYSRKFEMSKLEGAITTLKLSNLGVLPI